jgi:FkbH-like protein
MEMKDEDLTIKKISWDSKTESIQDIARELNLGMDSFVFLDDSDFETGLVREQLPSVATYKVPDSVYRYPALFRELETRFTQLSRSDEDLERTRQYREERMRVEERDRHVDLESYLKGLGIQLTVHLNDTKLIPRVAQMTQKTNQFNLTTRRYTDADIAAFVESDDADVLAFGVRDRYGDSGITAVGILRHDASVTIIDSLLLSCRIIGRTIEYAIMNHIIAHCVARGTKSVTGLYQSTEKNAQVAEYYPRCGFTASKPQERGSREFTLPVSQYTPSVLSYIEFINA